MFPVLFTLFGEDILSWYVFLGLAVLCGFGVFSWMSKIYKEDSFYYNNKSHLLVITYLSAWLGARSLSEIVEGKFIKVVLSDPFSLVGLGPMTFYGGAICGFIAGIIYSLIHGQNLKRGIDLAVPSTVLGLGVGRVGCFLNGDDYGMPVPLQGAPPFWAVQFPNLNDSLWRYPTQLEEAIFCFASVFVFLTIWKVRGMKEGYLGAFLILFSSLNRFVNEEYRADFRGSFFSSSLTTSQGIALILITGSLFFLVDDWLKIVKKKKL